MTIRTILPGSLAQGPSQRQMNGGKSYSPATIHKPAVPQIPLFAPLPRAAGGFPCLVADVPLRFSSNSLARPGRNAKACDAEAPALANAFISLEVAS
jgi:hypothetical protein